MYFLYSLLLATLSLTMICLHVSIFKAPLLRFSRFMCYHCITVYIRYMCYNLNYHFITVYNTILGKLTDTDSTGITIVTMMVTMVTNSPIQTAPAFLSTLTISQSSFWGASFIARPQFRPNPAYNKAVLK